MFSTKLANEIEKEDVAFLEAGIHEDVKFTSVRVDKGIKGTYFIELTFEKDGRKLVHTEWEPTMGPRTTEEMLKNKQTNQVHRMLDILKCFYDKSIPQFEGETFKSFADWVKMMLDNADKSKLLRIKVVYNDKRYTTLPNYTKYTWIEPMSIPTNESKISKLSIDKFVRPEIKADEDNGTENPFKKIEIAADITENKSDLPF